jgi:hypothetical protein
LHKPEDILLFQVFCGDKFTPSEPDGPRTHDIGLDKYDGYFSHLSEFRQMVKQSEIIAKPDGQAKPEQPPSP